MNAADKIVEKREESWTQDEIEGLIFALFEKWIEKKKDMENTAENEQELEALTKFSRLMGCADKSPLTMMYAGFRGGVEKGFDLAYEMEEAAEEKRAKKN